MKKEYNENSTDELFLFKQIDYNFLLNIISPIIICYSSLKVKQNYSLQKDFEGFNGSRVILSPIVKKARFNINKRKISKLYLGKLILKFYNTIITEFQYQDLNNFHNNLTTLTTSKKNFVFQDIINLENIKGTYNTINNHINLKKSVSESVIYHELFHMASTSLVKSSNTVFCGFAQLLPHQRIIGRSFNEGYTQLLTERYFYDNQDKFSVYVVEKYIAMLMEKILGRKEMESYYLNSGLSNLINDLNIYHDEQNIISFLDNIDFISKYIYKNIPFSRQNHLISEKLKEVSDFLIVCYVQKLNFSLLREEITEEVFDDLLSIFLEQVLITITVENLEYEVTNIERLNDTITNAKEVFEQKKLLLKK